MSKAKTKPSSSFYSKAVTANSEKIAIEEVKCKALADNAQKDLEEALPALEEAMRVSQWEGPGKGMGLGFFVLKVPGVVGRGGTSAGSCLHEGPVLHPELTPGCFLSKSLFPGPGVTEQEGYRRDQVLWTAPCPSGDSDAGSHDSSRQ